MVIAISCYRSANCDCFESSQATLTWCQLHQSRQSVSTISTSDSTETGAEPPSIRSSTPWNSLSFSRAELIQSASGGITRNSRAQKLNDLVDECCNNIRYIRSCVIYSQKTTPTFAVDDICICRRAPVFYTELMFDGIFSLQKDDCKANATNVTMYRFNPKLA